MPIFYSWLSFSRLVGSVSDEGTTFIPDALVNSTMGLVSAFTAELFGQDNADTLSRSQSYQPDPVDLTAPEYVAAAYAGDFFFNCPQRRLLAAAERTSVGAPALYQFVWAHRPSWLEPERLRVAHGSEIAFLFGVQPRTRFCFICVFLFAQWLDFRGLPAAWLPACLTVDFMYSYLCNSYITASR
jgi:carboxylesterase type B